MLIVLKKVILQTRIYRLIMHCLNVLIILCVFNCIQEKKWSHACLLLLLFLFGRGGFCVALWYVESDSRRFRFGLGRCWLRGWRWWWGGGSYVSSTSLFGLLPPLLRYTHDLFPNLGIVSQYFVKVILVQNK